MCALPIVEAKPADWQGPAPDPLDHPEYYEGIIFRRIVGHLIDLIFIVLLIGGLAAGFLVLGLISFGLFWIPLLFLGPAVTLSYDTLQVGGPRSATLGMRAMGLEVRSWTGARPIPSQAFLRALLFWGMAYMTAALLMWLVLGFALFNKRRRCLHDYFSGTVVVRSKQVMVLAP